jgi:hypothetical protein
MSNRISHRATKSQRTQARKDVKAFLAKQRQRATGRVRSELFAVLLPKEARL